MFRWYSATKPGVIRSYVQVHIPVKVILYSYLILKKMNERITDS
mgnify:FL=1